VIYVNHFALNNVYCWVRSEIVEGSIGPSGRAYVHLSRERGHYMWDPGHWTLEDKTGVEMKAHDIYVGHLRD